MGTRAQFFINDPRDTDNRQWLGCVAWDGYPEGDIGEALATVKTEAEFINAVRSIAKDRDDFCDPAHHGFPFPWSCDLLLTDFTYAWFDEGVQVACYHTGFVTLADVLTEDFEYPEEDTLPNDTPAPAQWDRSAPDSILVISR